MKKGTRVRQTGTHTNSLVPIYFSIKPCSVHVLVIIYKREPDRPELCVNLFFFFPFVFVVLRVHNMREPCKTILETISFWVRLKSLVWAMKICIVAPTTFRNYVNDFLRQEQELTIDLFP